MQEISKSAYRYIALIFALTAGYFWYLFYSFWFFLGKNYFTTDISSVLSIQNSKFATISAIVATVLTIIVMLLLFSYRKLRHYILDVGDELSRVSWATFKEVQKSSAVVILLVFVIGFTLFFADTLFQKLINAFMLL